MRTYLVRIKVLDAYMGNLRDPLYWHRTVSARSAGEAIAATRRDPDIPAGARMVAFPEGWW